MLIGVKLRTWAAGNSNGPGKNEKWTSEDLKLWDLGEGQHHFPLVGMEVCEWPPYVIFMVFIPWLPEGCYHTAAGWCHTEWFGYKRNSGDHPTQLLTQSRDKLGHKIMFRLSPRKNTPQPLLAHISGFEDLHAGKFPFISQDFPFSSLSKLPHVLLMCTSVMSLPPLSHWATMDGNIIFHCLVFWWINPTLSPSSYVLCFGPSHPGGFCWTHLFSFSQLWHSDPNRRVIIVTMSPSCTSASWCMSSNSVPFLISSLHASWWMTVERYFYDGVWSGESLKPLGGDLHVLKSKILSPYVVIPWKTWWDGEHLCE